MGQLPYLSLPFPLHLLETDSSTRATSVVTYKNGINDWRIIAKPCYVLYMFKRPEQTHNLIYIIQLQGIIDPAMLLSSDPVGSQSQPAFLLWILRDHRSSNILSTRSRRILYVTLSFVVESGCWVPSPGSSNMCN